MSATGNFGISEFTTHPWPFERDVERYAAHGVDFIEICEHKLSGDYAAPLATIPKAGLRVSSVQTTVHSLFPDSLQSQPADPNARLERILQSMERIAPHVPAATPFVVVTGAAPGGDVARVLGFAETALGQLAEAASGHGMRIAYEALNPVLFNTDTALWNLWEALDLVRSIGHPALGLCVDTWNDFPTPDAAGAIAECGDRIFLVQISDYRRPHAHADRVSLGDGRIDNAALVRAARSAGYTGPFVLEIFSAESLEDSIWRSNLDDAIERNKAAFATLWERSAP
jgi:sugar phosphate isomerase/epimerase